MSDIYRLNPDFTVTKTHMRDDSAWESKALFHLRETIEGKADVSTVFLVLDHGYDGIPMLFETLVFGGKLDGEMDRCTTHAEALEMHRRMCLRVIEAEDISG